MNRVLLAALCSVWTMGSALAADTKPNILVIWGDDIGYWNISHNNHGMMGYQTPNIDRVAKEGVAFTDYYSQQSCTAGRAAFISGSAPVRSGMTKVGMPGAAEGWQKTDVTMATVLKSQGYATGQFGKNHQGDRDEHLPTMHGFDEFLGNLYHLNAEEEPENEDYPGDMILANGKSFREVFGPRGVLHCWADGKGGQKIGSTLARQLALYVGIYSPIQMAADLPEHYAAHPDAFQFIKDVAVDWDESHVLAGEVGEYVAIARKARGAGEWFLGAMNDRQPRTLSLALDFLAPGQRYRAEVYRDGEGADWRGDARFRFVREQKTVARGDVLSLWLAGGGGAAVRFVPVGG